MSPSSQALAIERNPQRAQGNEARLELAERPDKVPGILCRQTAASLQVFDQLASWKEPSFIVVVFEEPSHRHPPGCTCKAVRMIPAADDDISD